jgi:hypothetical protein
MGMRITLVFFRSTSMQSIPLKAVLCLVSAYAFVWGLSAFGIVALVAAGIDYHEAEISMFLVAFLVMLVVFLAGFASRRAGSWVVSLAAAGGVMAGLSMVLQHRFII